MKDKRVWAVIGCILAIGIGVTQYTEYYVRSQSAVTAETTAPVKDMPAPASVLTPEAKDGAADGDGEAAQPEQGPAPKTAGQEESAQIYSEPDASGKAAPISPLTGVRSGGGQSGRTVDYRQRLMDLDTQIQRTREQDTDSNVYSIKTSAETELKMWESEMNTVYNALLDALPKEEAAKLAAGQQEWLKNRDANAAESSGRNSASVESIGYAATLVSLTRDRAYELVDRYEKAVGTDAQSEEEAPSAFQGR